ncbi:hypothetical protein HYFRA_00009703 [Hymenoscyphus fraxineus]|uniref:RNB domain-containing protein n=1 Tax=Hymenoscyphus fraxineus TaxID=746836 RepID=A0A9N9PSK5_9HELO|nr:hypothetical protein HYFRA_00009703 [Hymenoscyphus fraxineus]
MLRSLSTSAQARESFVCWQCLASWRQGARGKGRGGGGVRARARAGAIPSRPLLPTPQQRSLSTSVDAPIRITYVGGPEPPKAAISTDLGSNIRNRLRIWESQIGSDVAAVAAQAFEDVNQAGRALNTTGVTAYTGKLDDNTEDELIDEFHPFAEQELADVGGKRTFLLPGDLVELQILGNRYQELAIFVRDLGLQSQFFTMSGQWVQRRNTHPTFYVPGFVEQRELDDILPFLPNSDIQGDKLNKLTRFQEALPQLVGKSCIRKMLDFWRQADDAFVKLAPKIEAAHQVLARPHRTAYASLDEIAEKLLAGDNARLPGGKFPKTTLYAIHRRLLTHNIGIYTQQKGTLRAGGEYGIVSRSEVSETSSVTQLVRVYIAEKAKGAPPVRRGPLEGFVVKCQRLIDESRKHRQFTPYGMIGPSSEKSTGTQYREGCVREKFTPAENLFVRFLESWAGLKSFNQGALTLESVGSQILRSIDRYDDVLMDEKIAWTFLQEIGIIPPWETRAPYVLRLPQTGQRLQTEANVTDRGFVEDRLANIRRDWGDLPAFCIDAPTAHEIDDAISIEKTDNKDEHWLHIHVADPASRMDVAGAAAEFAQIIGSNVYLPDRVLSMLDSKVVQSKLSLVSGKKRPCMTFSAKLDIEGKMLDYNVSAGVLNNVVNLTPEVFEEIGSGKKVPDDTIIYTVGETPPASSKPSRKMSSVEDLFDHHESLKLLNHFGRLRLKLLRSQGGTYIGANKFSVHVDFRGPQWTQSLIGQSCTHAGDPTIHVSSKGIGRSQNGTLSYLMHLASEVCAKWCNARAIPTIYRVTPRNGSAESAPDYFRRVVAPILKEGKHIPPEIEQQYQTLVGPAQPSTVPGPHIAVGAEMLVKCTSPLRRYGDLLVHWQLGAALLEEHRTGRSLTSVDTDENIFPFTTAQLNSLLPRIDTRERVIRKAQNDAEMAWFMQFILRAWKFKEAELPQLTFIVKDFLKKENSESTTGVVTQFAVPALMKIPEWLEMDEISPSDVFEVEIADIDVVGGRLTVEPIRRSESGSE